MNFDIHTFILGIKYVINAPFFYYGMSGTVLGGLWIGASIYDNIVDNWKGILIVSGYAIFLLLTTVPRVLDSIADTSIKHSNPGMEYAGIITIIFILIYYVLGMLIGAYTLHRARKH